MAGAVLRTHNPLVAGSSPACPTFSTHTYERVFAHFTSNAKTSFYAIFTHSTAIDWHNSAQLLVFDLSFHKKFTDLIVFHWERWEQREQNYAHLYFQRLKFRFFVLNPINSLWECREHRLLSFCDNSFNFYPKKRQNIIEVRIICVIFAFKRLTPYLERVYFLIFGGMCIRCSGLLPSMLVYNILFLEVMWDQLEH
jgi:hypothetical protein